MNDENAVSAEAIQQFTELMQDPAARAAFAEVRHDRGQSGARARYSHVLGLVGAALWAVQPEVLDVVVDVLALRVEGVRFSPEELDERLAAGRAMHTGVESYGMNAEGSTAIVLRVDGGRFSPGEIDARMQAARRDNRGIEPDGVGVAVIPLTGMLVPRASAFESVSQTGTTVESFRNNFRSAMGASDIAGIVLDVDSPGGMVDQIPEMAAEIREARSRKPIVAVANTLAASGAYWLAAQAEEFVVTRSGRVGSIGVYTAHEDRSAADEKDGVKTTLVSAGKFKTEGNPFGPLSDEARADLQGKVDEMLGMFVSDVAKGRNTRLDAVRSGFGEGRVVMAKAAVAAGMADRIDTIDGAVQSLLRRVTARGSQGAAAALNVSVRGQADPGQLAQHVHDELLAEEPAPAPTNQLPEDDELRREIAELSGEEVDPDPPATEQTDGEDVDPDQLESDQLIAEVEAELSK